MASFLTDLAKTYVEKLINGVIAESSYICCFTCIANDFEEERARLQIESTTVKQRVDGATGRGEVIQANALFWKKEAEKLIQEDTKTKQKCLFGFCPHIIWRYKRGKELTKKKEEIKRLIETGKQLSIGLPGSLPGVERYSSQHYIPFESRKSKFKELLDALKDENNYITGLQGMGGTGKTTLAKEVGKALKESKQFTQIIDTAVSFSPEIKKIQDDIAGPLGLKFDECNESDRPKKLWSRLTNGEKILLILDDVWGDIKFDEIGIPDSGNNKGCRILVTTRNLLVCNRLGCSKTIQLDLLSEKDAWIMFQRHAGLSKISPKNFLEKGRKIANECKRLPVAIAAIASSLKGEQRPEEWDLVLNSLQKHVDTELLTIYKCFQVSYDNLKNENAKRLFLMCSVFREDEKVSTEMLTRICIGAGIFGEDCGNYENARNQFVRSKNKLIDFCLLLEVGQSRVKMHDLVRDAAQWIANKKIQTVKLYDKNKKAMVERETNIKYLLCEGKPKDVFSMLYGSKLEVLIVIMHMDLDCSNVKIEVLDSFFENNKGLRVLYLVFEFYYHYNNLDLKLPRSIESMKNIRSLLFQCVNLGDISILGNLHSLEILELIGCQIDELPHGITNLEKFRLLSLDICRISRNNPFEVIQGCSSLEELHFTTSFNEFCREISFPKLQRFYISESYRYWNESSSKFVSLVYEDAPFLSKTTLEYCLQEAEVLRLRGIEGGRRNIIPDIVPFDHGMNDLVELDLNFISQLQYLIDTKSQVSTVFSKLVVLKLEGMDNLEELFNGPLSFDSLNSLEKLFISDCKHLKNLFKFNLKLSNLKSVSLERCPMLISLFQLSTAVSLVLLETLKIKDCEGLENIITDERKGKESRGEIVDDNESTSQGSMFQKLKVLSIEKCPSFELILPLVSAHDLPALESITIQSCDKLKYIFGQDVKLGSLKKMELGGIPNFIDIFPECNRTMTSPIKKTSSISEPQEQSEPIKCNMFSWTDIYCCDKKYGHNKLTSTTNAKIPLVSEEQPQDNLMKSKSYPLNIWERAQCLSRQSHILCNIKEIRLWNISKMKSVFIMSIAPRMLLESLTINKCDELKHIIIDTRDHDNTGGNNWGTVFPKLRSVEVEDCEQLEYMIGHYSDDHVQNQREIHLHLPALKSLSLNNLPSLIGMCPKQYYTTFPPLKNLYIRECSQFAIKSIGDFITDHSETRFVDNTIIKELSGNVNHFLALERLALKRLVVKNNSEVKSIICLNETNEQQMNLALEDIDLDVLPMMTRPFVGPNNSFSLQNLRRIKIKRCEKLKIVFSTSIIRCLPQLVSIRIEECKELEHIIEDDSENKKSSNFMSTTKTCFPKVKILVVVKCNKLKYVLPISLCKELPELQGLIIREADELDEIFVSEGDDQKMVISNLKFVVFENLPSLSHAQGIQFQAVKHRFIKNCQKLSLASASSADIKNDRFASEFFCDRELVEYLRSLYLQLKKELTSPQKLMNEQSMDQQRPPRETDATFKPTEVSEISVEEGTTSANAKTITTSSSGPLCTSKHKTTSKENPHDQIDMTSFSIATTETNDKVSRNGDAFKKVSSNIEEQFPKDDDITVSKSKPSPLITSPVASQFPPVPSKGDPSQKVEDFSSSLLVKRELEQLLSKKHLDYENLSLLNDFFVKHPSVLLNDASLSSRYKGYAYNCLAELLKFLQTHSVLDVLDSNHSEFVELLQDVRRCGFHKEWLDDVEKRALLPGLQVSQDALQKLLDSKHILTQHVEDLKHQSASSEAVLQNITQQEAQILHTRAALSDPIGY